MLCTGPAFFRGTGPYSAGNLALQADIPCAPCRYNFTCPDPVCREIVSVDAVYDACCAMLRGKRPGDRGHGVKIYRSFFGDDGYLDWQRCDDGDAGAEALGERYGLMWKSCLDDRAILPPSSGISAERDSELVRIAGHGMEISASIAATARLTPLPVGELMQMGDAETGVAGQMKLYSALHPEYAPLVDFFSLMRDNIVTEDLPTIAEETRRCYAWARHLASSL
jgi:hypothetical protein